MSLEQARHLAAQCWCDEETKSTVMDVVLAEAFAKRIAVLMEQRDELLEACEKMLEAFDYAGTRLVGREYDAREAMKAAVKKARG